MYGLDGANTEITGVIKVCCVDTDTVTGSPVVRGAAGVRVMVIFLVAGMVACTEAAID